MPQGAVRRFGPIVSAAAAVAAVIAAVWALGVTVPHSPAISSASAAEVPPVDPATDPVTPTSLSQIKNVVLLLADDMDWALFDEVPRLAALKKSGTTLTNFVVTDSLCCPSRSSIMRAQFVHNHRVLSNVIQTGGGWQKFYQQHLEKDCLPTWLSAAGVQTALVGKYLNGFPKDAPSPRYIPPGWNHFVTALAGNDVYSGYDYTLNENGVLVKHGKGPGDFVNDVLTANAATWLSTSAKSPFFLELASYSPHAPAAVAARNRGSHAGARAPRPPSFNVRGVAEPRWLQRLPILGPHRIAHLDELWTRRLESAESVADSYDAIVEQLKATGQLANTLIIVTSDNGYHAGTHRLGTGKQTAYREDSIVPAVLIGPGIKPGETIDRMTSTIDLGPTIAHLLGARWPSWVDGRSLVPLIADPNTPAWRTGILSESLATAKKGDPDFESSGAPDFHALRTEDWLYVDYGRSGVALYDLVNDPYEINNVAPTTSKSAIAQLTAQLAALESCAGPRCRVADSMPVPPPSPIKPQIPAPSATPTPSPTATPSPSPVASSTASATPSSTATTSASPGG